MNTMSTPTILDGKIVAEKIKTQIATEVGVLKGKGLRAPHLVAIIVGHDGASETYVASKEKNSKKLGMDSTVYRYEADITEDFLLKRIEELNEDDGVDGILVQLPLPKQISSEKIIAAIDPEKDVDGFHPVNVGNMFKGLPSLLPATPYGILLLLEAYQVETEGKHCVVIGRSDIVGKPMSALMSRNAYPGNCTVTLCHSRTPDLAYFTRQADIVIAALGKPYAVTADMIKEGAVVIDVGITRVEDKEHPKGYKIAGDVDYDAVAKKSSYITPVPGGVGAMTIASVVQNTLNAYKRRKKI